MREIRVSTVRKKAISDKMKIIRAQQIIADHIISDADIKTISQAQKQQWQKWRERNHVNN